MKWIHRWYVKSHSNPNREYTVSLAEDEVTWGCSCPHWINNVPRPTCKHIREVQQETVNVRVDEFFTEEEFTI